MRPFAHCLCVYVRLSVHSNETALEPRSERGTQERTLRFKPFVCHTILYSVYGDVQVRIKLMENLFVTHFGQRRIGNYSLGVCTNIYIYLGPESIYNVALEIYFKCLLIHFIPETETMTFNDFLYFNFYCARTR